MGLLHENVGVGRGQEDIVIEEHPNSETSSEPLERCHTMLLSQVATTATIHQPPATTMNQMKVEDDPSLNQLEITNEEDQCLRQSSSSSSSQQPSSPDTGDYHQEIVDTCARSSGSQTVLPSHKVHHEGDSKKEEDIVVAATAVPPAAPSDDDDDAGVGAIDIVSQKNSFLHSLHLEREKRLSKAAQMELEAQQANLNDSWSNSTTF